MPFVITVLLLGTLPAQPQEEAVERLLKQLDGDDPGERDRASAELVRLGEKILPKLEKVAAASPSPEVGARLRGIILEIKVPSDVRALARRVVSGGWSWYGAPERPSLRDETLLLLANELRETPTLKVTYEKMAPRKGPGTLEDWQLAQEAIEELKKAKAAGCLTTGLYHSSYLVQLRCAEALSDLKDIRAVPALLEVAEALAIPVEGSKNATVHGFRQHGIAKALDRILDTSAGWPRQEQNTEALRKGSATWRAAYERLKKERQ